MTRHGPGHCIGAFALALAVLSQAAALTASASGEGGGPARAIIKGPYLQNVSKGNVTICWETDGPANATVLYGRDGPSGLSFVDANLSTFHEVRLTGLEADTTYHYLIASGGGTGTPSTFRTAPTGRTPFRFAVYGDSRTGHQSHTGILGGMRSRDPAFYLSTGDLLDSGASASDWQTFVGIISPFANDTPYWPSVGNHDLPPDLYKNHFSLPGNEMYYSFDYGGAHFIALDSTGELGNGSAQNEWLRADLERAAPSDWKFVFFHQPLYSSGLGHGSNLTLRAALDPVFERYRVNAVFNGHDHDYEHADPGNGVQYFVTGGGGAPLSPSGRSDFTVYSESAFHYMIVDVLEDPHHTRITAYRENGTLMETVHLSNVLRPPSPPGDLKVINSTPSSLTVEWAPPADPYLTGYRILLSENGSVRRAYDAGPVSDFTVGGLSPDTAYDLGICATYRDPLVGGLAYNSASVQVTGRTLPGAKHPPSVTMTSPHGGEIFHTGQTIGCAAAVSDPGQGDSLSFQWSLDGNLLPGSGPNTSIGPLRAGHHDLSVRVTDSLGDIATDSVSFRVIMGDPLPPPIEIASGPPVSPVMVVIAAFAVAGPAALYLLSRRGGA